MLHWLSTNYSLVYHISFPKGYHLTNASKQNIKSHYISKKELTDEYIDVVESLDSNPLMVTNLKKTVVDMLRYTKTSPNVVEEIVDNYLSREDKNIERLKEYGRHSILEE
ncbi:hypothetical protein [Tetragenococcus halophilus]|uniref:Uncharacterized protein n=3 Tax=Tetragenococcus halophilus TaxID=51669 RepID=A0A2H6CB10_TETHA|nr:hypothetical protein [Tetragenococcus halophilus]GBD64365.1 putative uncharacterized protein [Tetragenococcus halophilus subsp. flandriensis]AOF48789.1 hypothetical protein AC806_05000 [Tetragenococcus halophilus]AYW50391.1 hypothetical protein C7H83_07930 [Tetragenococcus halophilus]MCF1601180.1 hypothetical protein [Tetragenococcus halophilus]MCF1675634.1 hypothetical protein [Tetragenococcus halophilus]